MATPGGVSSRVAPGSCALIRLMRTELEHQKQQLVQRPGAALSHQTRKPSRGKTLGPHIVVTVLCALVLATGGRDEKTLPVARQADAPEWQTFTATAYSAEGQTASGAITREGRTVAADPSVLPAGTRIEVADAGAYSGSYIVQDTGPGFPEHILKRAFEPYVTTKAKGTGLGLAVVKKIADEHGARVDLKNRVVDGVVHGAQVSLSFAVAA